jgi:hypothetical protein
LTVSSRRLIGSALGDFEFVVENIVKPHIAFLPPSRWSELLIPDDLLDNSLSERRLERGLCYTGRTGCGNRSNGSESNHASRGTGQNLRFTSSDLGFAHCNIAPPSDKSLGSLGREHIPDTLVHGISGGGTAELGKESMTARTARIGDSTRRRVVEEMVLW